MRWIVLLLFAWSCIAMNGHAPLVNECVIGPKMDVLKLLRADEDKFLFVEYPYEKDSSIAVIEDVSALKKVECPE